MLQVKKMSSSSRAVLFALTLALYVVQVASAETLCGGELVDALQFVCEDRGFYFSRFPLRPFLFFHRSVAARSASARTSVWKAEAVAPSAAVWNACLLFFFLTHSHARSHTPPPLSLSRAHTHAHTLLSSCVSQEPAPAAPLSVPVLPRALTFRCI